MFCLLNNLTLKQKITDLIGKENYYEPTTIAILRSLVNNYFL